MDRSKLKPKVQVWVFSGLPESLEVLLLKTTPEREGFWQPITGSLEPGEDSRVAAARELFEETGLQLSGSELMDTGYEFEFESRWGGRVLERVWTCHVALSKAERSSIRLDSREHVAFEWRDLRQAEKMIPHASVKKGLEMAQNCVRKKI